MCAFWTGGQEDGRVAGLAVRTAPVDAGRFLSRVPVRLLHGAATVLHDAVAAHDGPVYFRFGRPKVPVITDANSPYIIGKARRVMTGSDVTLVDNGHLVWNANLAARELAADGISVDLIDMHTVKPLDESALLESVSRTGCVVSAEEHQRFGGLGESIAACLAAHNPTPQRFVAVEDSFGESGTPAQLLEKYGLGPGAIVKACREVISVKQGLPA